ncbi:unnamed protein product [Lepeophtheirus salmonis]|uniref:(salmon louse) hypothetical protein n=1 Tax=Lepeophtheirus salmonis TaxID=72036 RepID=A0A7R8H6M2_LEPSM|nr:unnamed protein product [Lepeophtheirus salmonis]CAF2886219.1 unnamed protein product [Lepeophtheirus salmonis]
MSFTHLQSTLELNVSSKKGRWVELDDKYRNPTTFVTPFGCFRYCRSPIGLNASGDEFRDRALQGLKGVRKVVNNILIFASNPEELLVRIKLDLVQYKEYSITLSKPKIHIGESVKYTGYIF